VYTKIKANQVPEKKNRTGGSRFMHTPEWEAMKKDMDQGIKPEEALQIALSEADRNRIGVKNYRTVQRFVERYIASKSLPYKVSSSSQDNGMKYIVVTLAGTATSAKEN
jgi:hypothetical protein